MNISNNLPVKLKLRNYIETVPLDMNDPLVKKVILEFDTKKPNDDQITNFNKLIEKINPNLRIKEIYSMFCCGETKYINFKEISKKIEHFQAQIINNGLELEFFKETRDNLSKKQREHEIAMKLLTKGSDRTLHDSHYRSLNHVKNLLNENEKRIKDNNNHLTIEESYITFSPSQRYYSFSNHEQIIND